MSGQPNESGYVLQVTTEGAWSGVWPVTHTHTHKSCDTPQICVESMGTTDICYWHAESNV